MLLNRMWIGLPSKAFFGTVAVVAAATLTAATSMGVAVSIDGVISEGAAVALPSVEPWQGEMARGEGGALDLEDQVEGETDEVDLGGAQELPEGAAGARSPSARRDRADRLHGQRHVSTGGSKGGSSSSFRRRTGGTSRAEQPAGRSGGGEDEGYESVRRYLTDADESPEELMDIPHILADPSNVISGDDQMSLLSWQVRDEEPRGSYLTAVEQDHLERITQVHRYFCPERRLDVLAEACVPVASVYSDEGVPMAVRYEEAGVVISETSDLDPSTFSRRDDTLDANEYLLFLQQYFDSVR